MKIGELLQWCAEIQMTTVGSSCVTFAGIIDAQVLEALACREALALVQDLLLPNIIVSLDC